MQCGLDLKASEPMEHFSLGSEILNEALNEKSVSLEQSLSKKTHIISL